MPKGRIKNSACGHKDAGKSKESRAKVPATEVRDALIEGGKVVHGLTVGPHLSSLLFWTNAPQPDPIFTPFYRRALAGDLQALVEFYRKHGTAPSEAFFQCIGYLATAGSSEDIKVVEKIMRINARGGPPKSSVAKRDSMRNWEQSVLPVAQAASRWISEQRRPERQPRNVPSGREQLWNNYLQQNMLPKKSTAFSAILTNFGHDATAPARKNHYVKLTQKELRVQHRDFQRFITSVSLSHGVIPKPLFFMLAQTTPQRLSPSVAVRRFVQKIVA